MTVTETFITYRKPVPKIPFRRSKKDNKKRRDKIKTIEVLGVLTWGQSVLTIIPPEFSLKHKGKIVFKIEVTKTPIKYTYNWHRHRGRCKRQYVNHQVKSKLEKFLTNIIKEKYFIDTYQTDNLKDHLKNIKQIKLYQSCLDDLSHNFALMEIL